MKASEIIKKQTNKQTTKRTNKQTDKQKTNKLALLYYRVSESCRAKISSAI